LVPPASAAALGTGKALPGAAPSVSCASGAAAGGANRAAMVSPNTVATPQIERAAMPKPTMSEVWSTRLALGWPGISAQYTATMCRRRSEMCTTLSRHPLGHPLVLATVVALASAAATGAAEARAKYYFRIGEVKAPGDTEAALKSFAGDALKEELSSRANWASDVQADDDATLVSELKRRGLRGFDVTLRLEKPGLELKEPKPGGHLKRLAIDVRLTVFGTAIPGAKLAFSGNGEAGVESEVTDRQVESEGPATTRDAIKDAIKQAVDQAEAKLSLGVSAPLNESKRRRK
jgi:hypothetical protein